MSPIFAQDWQQGCNRARTKPTTGHCCCIHVCLFSCAAPPPTSDSNRCPQTMARLCPRRTAASRSLSLLSPAPQPPAVTAASPTLQPSASHPHSWAYKAAPQPSLCCYPGNDGPCRKALPKSHGRSTAQVQAHHVVQSALCTGLS